MVTQHKQSRGTENLTSCPIRSSDDRLPMLTFRLRYKELQPKEGREGERESKRQEGDGLSGGDREPLTQIERKLKAPSVKLQL